MGKIHHFRIHNMKTAIYCYHIQSHEFHLEANKKMIIYKNGLHYGARIAMADQTLPERYLEWNFIFKTLLDTLIAIELLLQ